MKKSSVLSIGMICLGFGLLAPASFASLPAIQAEPAGLQHRAKPTPVENTTLDFTLQNDLGFGIYELYVSGHGDDEWGDDILGDEVLEDQDETAIEFDEEEGETCWDLQIKGEDGKIWHWKKGFDMSKIVSIRLFFKPNGQAWAVATPPTAYGCESSVDE